LDGLQSHDFVLCGDFNPGGVGSLLEVHMRALLSSYGLVQHVRSPTRGLNILDLVITPQDSSQVCDLFVTDPGVSDHKLVSFCLAVQSSPILKDTSRRFRHIINLNATRLISLVEKSKISNSSFNHPDPFCMQLEDDVTSILDIVAPFRTTTMRRSNNGHFMLSPEARAANVYRRKPEASLSSSPSPGKKRAYNIACRRANKLIRVCRQDHLTKILT